MIIDYFPTELQQTISIITQKSYTQIKIFLNGLDSFFTVGFPVSSTSSVLIETSCFGCVVELSSSHRLRNCLSAMCHMQYLAGSLIPQ